MKIYALILNMGKAGIATQFSHKLIHFVIFTLPNQIILQ
jgi:hypothetical protein